MIVFSKMQPFYFGPTDGMFGMAFIGYYIPIDEILRHALKVAFFHFKC